MTAPLAIKYGGLIKVLNGAVGAGAMAGASVLVAGVWNGWVQEQLGKQMNELHATSGQLAEHVAGPPYEDYYPGDWVAMRELRDRAWVPRIGLVLHGSKENTRYWRFRVGVLPSSEIVWRDAADLALLDQQKMAAAVKVDPKLDVWRAAMAVKDDAMYRRRRLQRRRLPEVSAADPDATETEEEVDPEEEEVDIGMGNVLSFEEEEDTSLLDEVLETERQRAALMNADVQDLRSSGVGNPAHVQQEGAQSVRDDYELLQKYMARPRVTEQKLNQWATVDAAWVELTGIDRDGEMYFRRGSAWVRLPTATMTTGRRPTPPPNPAAAYELPESDAGDEAGPSVPVLNLPVSAPAFSGKFSAASSEISEMEYRGPPGPASKPTPAEPTASEEGTPWWYWLLTLLGILFGTWIIVP